MTASTKLFPARLPHTSHASSDAEVGGVSRPVCLR
jgi:hypothetical protein